ncbi:VOC family protein [Chungangia koreensis]|uniref:VOC family protein n=1 Tax=Chungangia koreensis TaxID=752657 RepID=A0ABV8X779_9LACT
MSFLKGIDHIQVAAPKGSENEARRFYSEVLGMEELEKPDLLKGRGGCWFICGQQEVHVGIEEPFNPSKKAHPGFIADNLEELRNKLHSAGYLVKEDAPIAGRNRFFTEDPFGNRIEFLEFGKDDGRTK